MGYWSNANKDQGRLFLNTQSPLQAPFCVQSYQITFYSNNIDSIFFENSHTIFYMINLIYSLYLKIYCRQEECLNCIS
jgi:hypothetical protein